MDFEANLAHCVSERCARGSSSLPGLQEEEEWGQKDTDTVQDGRGQLTPHCYRWICHIPSKTLPNDENSLSCLPRSAIMQHRASLHCAGSRGTEGTCLGERENCLRG